MRRFSSSLLLAITLLAAGAAVGCDDDRTSTPFDAGPMPMVDANLPPGVDGGPTTGTDAGPTTPTSPLVDPDCADGMFSEALPDPTVDLTDLEDSYSAADPVSFILAVLERRYTSGRVMVEGGRGGAQDCAMIFLRDTSSPDAIYGQLGTVVHECGHFYDNELSRSAPTTYYINDAPLQVTCRQGDSTDRGGLTFARSRIRGDAFSASRPPCSGGSGCDFYADIYLDGDPDDGAFQGGDQGFNLLFEELVQYVNSLATSYAFTDELNTGGRSSQKDGLLTFLWYLERYLYMARNDYPSAYAHILNGDGGCWRDLILQVWGRAFLYLGITEDMPHLGIDDAALLSLVETPDLLAEIQRVRDAAGCGE